MARVQHNLAEETRRLRDIADAVPDDLRDRLVRIGAHGYQELTTKTEDTGSVDTGAYRAEHIIEQGGRFLYEHPGRVGPDTPLPSQKALGAGPLIPAAQTSEVESALQGGLELGGFSYLNQRFYAEGLENGTAAVEPRQIYATAEDATQAFADSVAVEKSRRPELA